MLAHRAPTAACRPWCLEFSRPSRSRRLTGAACSSLSSVRATPRAGTRLPAMESWACRPRFKLLVRNVIAGLWKVPDDATAELMEDFYRLLWEEKRTPLAALREAQLIMLRRPRRSKGLTRGGIGPHRAAPEPPVGKSRFRRSPHPRLGRICACWARILNPSPRGRSPAGRRGGYHRECGASCAATRNAVNDFLWPISPEIDPKHGSAATSAAVAARDIVGVDLLRNPAPSDAQPVPR